MYNYKSDLSRKEPDYVVEVQEDFEDNTWLSRNFGFLNKFAYPKRWHGHHQLLPTTDSPSISACTTATNLSSLDIRQSFGSIILNNRKMGTLEGNLRVAQPEIEPLHLNQKIELPDSTKGSINGNPNNLSVYNQTTEEKPRIQLFHQVLAALSVSLVSMAVGYVSAYTSPAEETLKRNFMITDEQYSWVCGLMPLGALIGGLFGGIMVEVLGRKTTILVTDILFMVSWFCIASAPTIWYIFAGRCIAGFSVGVASLSLPVYLGETIQPEVRGALGLLPTAFGNVGILLCFIVGSYVQWDNLAWVGIALPVPFLVLMFLVPETPRWYISKGREESARKALQWLRGKESNIQEEFDELTKSQKEAEKSSSSASVSDLFTRAHMKPLLISLGLMFFQQMSGINAVIFYTTSIFSMAGSTIDKNVCTIIVGLVNFASTFIATLLIDRLGRKILLYISSVSMTLTLGTLGTYFYVSRIGIDTSSVGWLPLASFVIFVLGFSLGFGPIPWLMMGEILPAKIRGSAASVATSFNWMCTFIVTKSFVDIIDLIGTHGTFWFFSGVCLVSIAFVITWVPETQGQSLQDIEKKLAGLQVRRMSSVANLKPMPSTL